MRQAEKQNRNYQNKNPQFVFPVESLQETSPEQDQDPFMTPPNKSPEVNTTTKATAIQGIEAEAADAIVEKVVDLRKDRKSFFLSFPWQGVGSYN